MSLRRGAQLAGAVFVCTWVPLTLWRGLAQGRSFRIGAEGQGAVSPLIEGVIQLAFVMLVPAMLLALLAFALWAWREERRRAR